MHDVAAYLTLMGRKFDPATKTRPGTAHPVNRETRRRKPLRFDRQPLR